MPGENFIDLDFSHSTPVQEAGGFGDRVPEGGYVLEVQRAEKVDAQSGRPMVRVNYVVVSSPGREDYQNKRISEQFVMPRPGTDDATFGLDRFHGFMVACGAPQQNSARRIDLNNFQKRRIVSELHDDEYNGRVRSIPVSYFSTASSEGAELLQRPLGPMLAVQPSSNGTRPAPAPAADTSLFNPTPVPAAAQAVAAPAAAPAMNDPFAGTPATPAASATVSSELDALFR